MITNGLPARIQVDNGKEFDSNFMKEFCNSLGITLEFRPVKQPQYGGIVESAWDTINDELRNRAQEFGGVVYPKKIRKNQEYIGRDLRIMILKRQQK